MDKNTGSEVGPFAMKRLRGQLGESFKREIEMLGRLNHENILGLVDHFRTYDHHFIITEFCGGGDMKSFIDKYKSSNQCIPPFLVWKLGSQMARGLRYLHSNKNMHQDLKPANILMTDGSDLKIADFGIANNDAGSTVMSHSGGGTTMYKAPEVLRGDTYNNLCDVWSLGCILYELMYASFVGLPWFTQNIFSNERR